MYKNISNTGKILGNPLNTAIVVFVVVLCAISLYFFFRSLQVDYYNDLNANTYDTLIKNYSKQMDTLSNEKIRIYIDSFDEELFFPVSGNPPWYSDEVVFGEQINTVFSLLSAAINPKSKYYKSPEIWKIIETTITKVQVRIPTRLASFTLPFGKNNWYQFSITYPRFLVATAYARQNLFKDKFQKQLSGYLTSYTSLAYAEPADETTGILSFGWKRELSNTVMCAVPYIGAKLFLKKQKQLNTSNICKYVDNFTRLNAVTNGDGFYEDGTFIFHTTLRAYGYLSSAFHDFILISKYFNHDITPKFKKIFSMIEHPDFKVHFGPWFGRSNSLRTSLSQYGTYGIHVIDKMAGISVKNKKFFSVFNLQRPELCFYESDKTNDEYMNIWTQLRQPLDANTQPTYEVAQIPYFTGVITFEKKVVHFTTQTTTTSGFLPKSARSVMCKGSDCVGYKQNYEIENFGYNVNVSEIGLVSQTEIACFYRILHQSLEKLTFGCYFGKTIETTTLNNVFLANGTVRIEIINAPSTATTTIVKLGMKNSSELYEGLILTMTATEMTEFGIVLTYGQFTDINAMDINSIKTSNVTLLDDEGTLFLHDETKETCVVSNWMESAAAKQISVPSEIILRHIDNPAGPVLISNNFVINRQDNRYQMMITGVETFKMLSTPVVEEEKIIL